MAAECRDDARSYDEVERGLEQIRSGGAEAAAGRDAHTVVEPIVDDQQCDRSNRDRE